MMAKIGHIETPVREATFVVDDVRTIDFLSDVKHPQALQFILGAIRDNPDLPSMVVAHSFSNKLSFVVMYFPTEPSGLSLRGNQLMLVVAPNTEELIRFFQNMGSMTPRSTKLQAIHIIVRDALYMLNEEKKMFDAEKHNDK